MTLAQAKACASDLLDNGYDAVVSQISSGTWVVQTQMPTSIPRATVDAFAAAHTVTVQTYTTNTAAVFA